MSSETKINPSQDTFVRREEKFLLPLDYLVDLQQLIDVRSICADLDTVKTKKEAYYVDSIYYDSPKHALYQEHFALDQRRYKLRERNYSLTQERTGKATSHLELKAKENGICNKARLKVKNIDLEKFRGGTPLQFTNEARQLNKKTDPESLGSLIENINDVMRDHCLRPVCHVSYFRQAYEEGNFRITYDENLNYKVLNPIDFNLIPGIQQKEWWSRALLMQQSFDKKRHAVVELKHNGNIPTWMTDFMESHELGSASFSKYCYSMTDSLVSLTAQALGRPAQSVRLAV